jgi:hypothetical protein
MLHVPAVAGPEESHERARFHCRAPCRLPDRAVAVPALVVFHRGQRRDADAGHRRERRAAARLQAEAEQLRPRRRHRAERCREPHPLRAPGSAQRDRHERQGPHLLLGRQHLHARRVEPRVEGELLQVHERDPQRSRGFQCAIRPEVHRRRERRVCRWRLRTGTRVRRDRPRRRPVVVRVAARGAAARRAARHRRTHPDHRQAQGAARPRGRLLHDDRRRAREEGARLAARRRGREAGAVRGARSRPCRRARRAE